MKIQIVDSRDFSRQSAWGKAPTDVSIIAEQLGYRRFVIGRYCVNDARFVRRVLNKFRLAWLLDRFTWKLELLQLCRMFSNGGELLIQHPCMCRYLHMEAVVKDLRRLKRHKVRITLLVHDVSQLRRLNDGSENSEGRIFDLADKVIVHNENMLRWFNETYPLGHYVVPLEIFDYLLDEKCHVVEHKPGREIVIAGGLSPVLGSFMADLWKISGVKWKLYGPKAAPDQTWAGEVHHCGSFPPDELPSVLSGSWGLVWSGSSIDTCTGPSGEYLRYINSHKLSLYIVSHLPVIVWKESAVAAFVREYEVGVCVGSLHEIPEVIAKISNEQYARFVKNCRALSCLLRSGEFTKRALEA